ncbi:TPA: hypothetical protein N0F65_012206 [Lagenidium giganteum]|uniref:Calcineurin-like phosphoesterase domain-containing protein n=1 Tax=Lagenidium giganteum TaxID=4803 RepID=A0AAV2ZIX2_9STRA|nr:TPA: hypothetical protein N0F65_012206 [Lagenidium giganteum]
MLCIAQSLLFLLLQIIAVFAFIDSQSDTTRHALDEQHFVLTDVHLTTGEDLDSALDSCAQPGWLPVGVNLADDQASFTPPLLAPFSPYLFTWYWAPRTQFAFLCVRQRHRNDIRPDEQVVRDVMVLRHARACPGDMEQLSQPQPDTRVCVAFARADDALPNERYVIDLTTTAEEFYNHETPGWLTHSISVHLAPPHHWHSDRRVFLSVRKPVRPITRIRFATVEANDPTALFVACQQLAPAHTWERPGFGFLNLPAEQASYGTFCVQHLQIGQEPSQQLVLEDVQLVPCSNHCPRGYRTNKNDDDVVIVGSDYKICARWRTLGSLKTDFVTDLVLHRTKQSPRLVQATDLPGQWVFLPRELNHRRHGTSAFLFIRKTTPPLRDRFLQRHHIRRRNAAVEPMDVMLQRQLNGQADTDAKHRRPPLRAKWHNESNTLSFRVLQIADLHLSGDPNRPCDGAPKSARRDLLEAASKKAADMTKKYWGGHLPKAHGHVHHRHHHHHHHHYLRRGHPYDPLFYSCREVWSLTFLDELLDLEKPDFVVFTGDNVDVYEVESRRVAMDAYSASVEQRGIPWTMVFGNHDTDGGFPLEEMMAIVRDKRFSFAKHGPAHVDGVGNFELNVQAPVDGPWGARDATVFRMYFLDSHEGTSSDDHPAMIAGSAYDWIKESQIEFYRQLVTAHTREEDKVPALMFFHIPLPEYALSSPTTQSGKRLEAVMSPDVNSGLFSALVEMNDVKATFVGHDHYNEYCYKRQGIQLCYGGGIGFGRAYGDGAVDRRARIIEWTVDKHNKRKICSWKRHFHDPRRRRSHEVLYEE